MHTENEMNIAAGTWDPKFATHKWRAADIEKDELLAGEQVERDRLRRVVAERLLFE